jgi:hypothetical protein
VSWTRFFAILAVFGVLLVGVLFLLDHGIHHWGWRPPILAMISLTISNLALALWAVIFVLGKRRKKSRHA